MILKLDSYDSNKAKRNREMIKSGKTNNAYDHFAHSIFHGRKRESENLFKIPGISKLIK